METLFINTENSETNESNRFYYDFTDKFNLENLNKNTAFVNLSFYYTWTNIKSAYKFKINLKYLFQLGMMNMICLIVHILFQTFKIILNILLKKT